jgi:hypothetical protein
MNKKVRSNNSTEIIPDESASGDMIIVCDNKNPMGKLNNKHCMLFDTKPYLLDIYNSYLRVRNRSNEYHQKTESENSLLQQKSLRDVILEQISLDYPRSKIVYNYIHHLGQCGMKKFISELNPVYNLVPRNFLPDLTLGDLIMMVCTQPALFHSFYIISNLYTREEENLYVVDSSDRAKVFITEKGKYLNVVIRKKFKLIDVMKDSQINTYHVKITFNLYYYTLSDGDCGLLEWIIK